VVIVDFKEARDRTLEVVSRIEELTGKKWGPEARFIDLVEEVGELANAILVKENIKTRKKRSSDLADSIADVLYNLILLAHLYGFELDKIYEEMLDELKKRVENKEFSD
jgi:NTP pyrophosphatase (non-canonical NTP hydrolase)